MPAERDPRLDPMPGDVLRYTTSLKCITTERRVISVSARKVVYRQNDCFNIDDWRNEWKRWAATAEVISRAEEQS